MLSRISHDIINFKPRDGQVLLDGLAESVPARLQEIDSWFRALPPIMSLDTPAEDDDVDCIAQLAEGEGGILDHLSPTAHVDQDWHPVRAAQADGRHACEAVERGRGTEVDQAQQAVDDGRHQCHSSQLGHRKGILMYELPQNAHFAGHT